MQRDIHVQPPFNFPSFATLRTRTSVICILSWSPFSLRIIPGPFGYNAYRSFFSTTTFTPFSPTCLVFALIVSLLSTIQFSIYVLSPRYTSFRIIEFLITQLFPTNTFFLLYHNKRLLQAHKWWSKDS